MQSFGSGSAARLCGKPLAFRLLSPLIFREAMPRLRQGVGLLEIKVGLNGKAQPFRTAKRQSRRNVYTFNAYPEFHVKKLRSHIKLVETSLGPYKYSLLSVFDACPPSSVFTSMSFDLK
jgi:hypothetical protein